MATLYEIGDTLEAQERLAREAAGFPKLWDGFEIEHALDRPEIPEDAPLTPYERELAEKAAQIRETLDEMLPDVDMWFCPPFGFSPNSDEDERFQCGIIAHGIGSALADIRAFNVLGDLAAGMRDGAIERLLLADRLELLATGGEA